MKTSCVRVHTMSRNSTSKNPIVHFNLDRAIQNLHKCIKIVIDKYRLSARHLVVTDNEL